MTKHTKTPWRTVRHNDYTGKVMIETDDVYIADCDCKSDSLERDEANAAFIVKAANAYEGLVTALQEVAELTARQQLPLTAQVHELVTAALSKADALEQLP